MLMPVQLPTSALRLAQTLVVASYRYRPCFSLPLALAPFFFSSSQDDHEAWSKKKRDDHEAGHPAYDLHLVRAAAGGARLGEAVARAGGGRGRGGGQ